ncbi:reticulon-4-interacting protein 1 homolog, mitochondrial-like [Amphiura filiformis]|uniref:reticulon-4-interacting protein 1 homolog, mitochondrial-like n=1 Tax=Amphiura filiformis TaxID=82378 RepID=UPI003B224988
MSNLPIVFFVLSTAFFVFVPNDFSFQISEFPVNRGSLTITCAIAAVVLFIKDRLDANGDNVTTKKPKHTTPGKKMKAIIITKYGNDTIEYSDDKINVPKLKQPSDILVHVKAASLNPVDLMISQGNGRVMYNKMRMAKGEPAERDAELPLVLGHDVSGVVVKVGKDVKKVKAGDEVWASIPIWRSEGTLAEYAIVNEYDVSHKPNNLSHTEAASLPFVALSVWTSLVKSMAINSKQAKKRRILILGGTGGVGTFAIQLIKAWGGHVTTTCSKGGIELMKRLGADQIIDYTKEDFETVLSQKKQKFHLILDTQGPSSYQACLNLCGSGGHVVTLVSPLHSMTDKHGLVWGAIKATLARLKIGIPQKLFHSRSFSWGIYAPDGEALDKIKLLVEAGKIKPVIEETFPLCEGVAAFQQLSTGHRKGKIVIDVDDR